MNRFNFGFSPEEMEKQLLSFLEVAENGKNEKKDTKEDKVEKLEEDKRLLEWIRENIFNVEYDTSGYSEEDIKNLNRMKDEANKEIDKELYDIDAEISLLTKPFETPKDSCGCSKESGKNIEIRDPEEWDGECDKKNCACDHKRKAFQPEDSGKENKAPEKQNPDKVGTWNDHVDEFVFYPFSVDGKSKWDEASLIVSVEDEDKIKIVSEIKNKTYAPDICDTETRVIVIPKAPGSSLETIEAKKSDKDHGVSIVLKKQKKKGYTIFLQ